MAKRLFAPIKDGPYRTVVADPPWHYQDKLNKDGTRSAANHYPTLKMDELVELGQLLVPQLDEQAHLYLWCTNAFVEDAHRLAREWGFRPKTMLTWVKTVKSVEGDAVVDEDAATGMGHYFRGSTEHVVFATRGKKALKPGARNIRTVFFAPRQEHSAKPQAFYDLATRMSPASRLELFARDAHKGFVPWGNQVRETA